MIVWDDGSNAIAEGYACVLGPLSVYLYRERAREPGVWWVDLQRAPSTCEARTWQLAAHLDASEAQARALLLVQPLVIAVADRACAVARDVAIAVAEARLRGVG